MSVRVGIIDRNLRITGLILDTFAITRRYAITTYPLTPTLYRCTRVICIEVRTGHQHRSNMQRGIITADRPHLLREPGRIACLMHTHVRARLLNLQEITGRFEFNA